MQNGRPTGTAVLHKYLGLAGFLVHSVRIAARAVLVHLKTIGIVTTILLGDVVALFALLARQGDLGADVALGHGSAFPRYETYWNTVLRFWSSVLVVQVLLVAEAGLEPATQRL